jgi:hypothetical protein
MGVSVFHGPTFEEIEADRSATGQAFLVVLVSAIAGGMGARGYLEPSLTFLAIFATIALVVWLGWAYLILQIGGRQLRQPETQVDLAELLRTTGFAAAPGMLQIFALVPEIATPVFVVTWIWMWAAMVVAVKHSLDMRSTLHAVVICGAALALVIAMAVLLTHGFDRVVV